MWKKSVKKKVFAICLNIGNIDIFVVCKQYPGRVFLACRKKRMKIGKVGGVCITMVGDSWLYFDTFYCYSFSIS